MQFKLLHCWDCGTQVIGYDGARYHPMPHLREVTFNLTGNSVMKSPFCQTCAEKTWTPDRLAAFKTAVDQVNPSARGLQVLSAEAVTTPAEILGVVR